MKNPAGSHTPKEFRSLLVPIDLSPLSDRVVARIARLPLAEDARVTLLHVIPKNLPAATRRGAERDARRALEAEVESLTRTLPRSVAIRQIVRAGAAAAEISRCARAVKAELIVMGRGGGRELRDAFLGSTAERVIRQAKLPVLAVRIRVRAPYRRPALALDTDPTALAAIIMLLRVIPPPRPRVAVIHAYDPPYLGRTYPSLSEHGAEEYRNRYRHEAHRKIRALLSAALRQAKVPSKDAPAWKTRLHHGMPRTIVENAVEKADADLLVIGSRGYSGVAYAFLGTVAGDLLRAVTCDVLVVPPRRETSRRDPTKPRPRT